MLRGIHAALAGRNAGKGRKSVQRRLATQRHLAALVDA